MSKFFGYIFTPLFYLLFFGFLCIFHPIQWICFKFFGYKAHKSSVDVLNFFLTYCNFSLFNSVTFINHQNLPTNQPIIFVLGHYGHWEWCGQSFHLRKEFQQDVLYHPLSNPFFNWLTYKLRARWGVGLIPMQVSIKEMIRRKDMLTATAFLADQTPSNKDACHWMPFLNQDTPVFLGTEKIAKKLNRPVVFVHLNRIKRGYYETSFTVIAASPKDTPDNWITEQHTHLLQADIIKRPELWLWSHRRWKHKRQEG